MAVKTSQELIPSGQEPTVEAVTTLKAAPSTTPTVGVQTESPKPEMTIEDYKAALKAANSEAAKYRKEKADAQKAADDVAKKSLEEQGNYKTLYEKEKLDKESLIQEAAKKQREELRTKVATANGVPEKLAKFITGETEEEMIASAKEIAGAIPNAKVKIGNDAAVGNVKLSSGEVVNGLTQEQINDRYGIRVPKGR